MLVQLATDVVREYGPSALSSEVGVLDDLADSAVAIKGRLEPGRMFLIDFDQGRIIPDEELKTMMAAARPYAQWMAEQPLRLADWVAQAGVSAPAHPPREQLNSHLAMHGFTKESAGVLVVRWPRATRRSARWASTRRSRCSRSSRARPRTTSSSSSRR